MSRQVPHAEDIATGTPTAGLVPVSAGPGLAPAWGAAGGGGGSSDDWTELVSYTVPAGGGEASINFGSLSQSYKALVAVGDNIQYEAFSVADGHYIAFLANGWNGNDYLNTVHRYGGTGTTHDVLVPNAGNAGAVGYAPGPAGDEPVGSFTVWFPGYTVMGRYKNWHGHAAYAFGGTRYGFEVAGTARLGGASHSNIDQLTFYAGYSAGGSPTDLFAPGSRVTIYGVGGTGGGGGGGGGDWSLIEHKIITVATAAPLSFTVPNTFRNLRTMGQVRVTDAVLWTDVTLRFNNDTTAFHYGRLQLNFDGAASEAVQYQATRSSIPIGLGAGSSAGAGYAGLIDVEIPNYIGSTFYKQVLQRGHHTDDNVATNYALHNEGGGIWYGTAPVTSIQIGGGTSFDVGTVVSLYGLK
jgi:hypothetical protein